MSIQGSVDLSRLWELNRLNREAIQTLQQGSDIFISALATMAGILGDAAQKTSPVLTSTLKSAHRRKVQDNLGLVFIDPTVVNPILGGKPVDYGPEVHEQNPWFKGAFDSNEDRAAKVGKNIIIKALEIIYV